MFMYRVPYLDCACSESDSHSQYQWFNTDDKLDSMVDLLARLLEADSVTRCFAISDGYTI